MTREEAHNILYNELIDAPSEQEWCTAFRMAIEALEQEPKTKVGKWIESHIPESVLVECSECGFSCGAPSFNYCPMCGAKMEGKE